MNVENIKHDTTPLNEHHDTLLDEFNHKIYEIKENELLNNEPENKAKAITDSKGSYK